MRVRVSVFLLAAAAVSYIVVVSQRPISYPSVAGVAEGLSGQRGVAGVAENTVQDSNTTQLPALLSARPAPLCRRMARARLFSTRRGRRALALDVPVAVTVRIGRLHRTPGLLERADVEVDRRVLCAPRVLVAVHLVGELAPAAEALDGLVVIG